MTSSPGGFIRRNWSTGRDSAVTFPRWVFSASLMVCAAFSYMGTADAAQAEQPSAAPATEAIPDLQGLWITMLESIPSDDPIREGARSPWYVSVADTERSISDPPPAVTVRVNIPGVQVLPGSMSPSNGMWQPAASSPPLIFIHFPTRLANGQYDVSCESYIGGVPGPHISRVLMTHDAAGWHVLSYGPYPAPDDGTVPIM